MARARNLKPGFFTNEDLAECTPWARLCFAGLWTLADREGRLEDRPKRIKGQLFPFDTVDVVPLLAELAAHHFIQRYEAPGGLELIQINAFLKHQNPHHREPPSILPPPQSPGLNGHAIDAKPGASMPLQGSKAQGQPEAEGGSDDGSDQGEPRAGPGLDPPRVDLARGSSRAESGIDESGAMNPEKDKRERVPTPAPPPPRRARGPEGPGEPGDPPPQRGQQGPAPAAPAGPAAPAAPPVQTVAGKIAMGMRNAGMAITNPGDPRFLKLIEQGATEAEFVDLAAQAARTGKGWAWVLVALQNRRSEAAAIRLAPAPGQEPLGDDWETRGGVERIAKRLGIEPWDETVPFPAYRAKVRSRYVPPPAEASP